MPLVKLLHAFQKCKEIERLTDWQFITLQLSDALALLRKVMPAQPNMSSDHADIVGKRH
jgi:hypothetical protein